MEVKTQVRTETVITDNMMEKSGLPDLHNSDVLVMVTEANLSRDCFCLQIHSLRGQYVREGKKQKTTCLRHKRLFPTSLKILINKHHKCSSDLYKYTSPVIHLLLVLLLIKGMVESTH
jgi:hypothetical protein